MTSTVHPQVRGDGGVGLHVTVVAVRFTPTCVGTASSSTCNTRLSTVHPHVRGDGGGESTESAFAAGSPPRAWGRLLEQCRRHVRGRFTPTCVGTALPGFVGIHSCSVHPHVRGDGAG